MGIHHSLAGETYSNMTKMCFALLGIRLLNNT